MTLNTSLKGRLRNTNLPKTKPLLPLFEAVVNSIHSIDERIINESESKLDISNTYINIKIVRLNQQLLDNSNNKKPEITGFEIIDNGIGFNDANYKSFETLDSNYKIEKGCRGIGRLLWLKIFKNVSIISIFNSDDGFKERKFDFNTDNEIHNDKLSPSSSESLKTIVKLQSISTEYSKYLKNTADAISRSLFEHCMWYFLRNNGIPKIKVIDDDDIVLLENIYKEYTFRGTETGSFELKSEKFDIKHVKLDSTPKDNHFAIYCASDRVVREEIIKGIPGLFGVLNDGESDFYYMCFVISGFFDENVLPERTNFGILESSKDGEISFNDIHCMVLEKAKEYLGDCLAVNQEKGKQRVHEFVNNMAPRYKPILKRIPDHELMVDPQISDKDLDLKLHKELSKIESELLAEGHSLQPQYFEDPFEYNERISDYLSKVSDIKKSDLAGYVAHRKIIIDLLSKCIEINDDGNYSREEFIHKLIIPMREDSNGIFSDDINLWLIDERLAFHNYLASDKKLSSLPIINSSENKRPDILSLNVYDNPMLVSEGKSIPLATITVVEIKKPMRNDASAGVKNDPIEQALSYLKKIRDGNVTTSTGRPIPNSEDIPGFCYVLCDITPTIKDRCELFNLNVTADKSGYFGYNRNYNAYIEVISFDRLVKSARERNRAFFDKLGLPTN